METGQVDIIGAGIAGLATGIALALRGWSVRVHEKSQELRERGVGIGIWVNGQNVLQSLGADTYCDDARKMLSYRLVDETNQTLRHQQFTVENGPLVMLRPVLYNALVRRATECGVEILTNSRTVSVSSDGDVTTHDGRQYHADLVVGADGYSSFVRGVLGLQEHGGFLSDAAVGRVVVPLQPDDDTAEIVEHWSGARRVGVMAASSECLYLFLSTPEDPAERNSRYLMLDRWTNAFPHLEALFARITGEVRWDRYSYIKCHQWTKGRVALIGDAAHTMPTTLAQGAGTALMDALSLAVEVSRASSISEGLARWEERHRPVIELTQDIAIAYLLMSVKWPSDILALRSRLIGKLLTSTEVNALMSAAARHVIE